VVVAGDRSYVERCIREGEGRMMELRARGVSGGIQEERGVRLGAVEQFAMGLQLSVCSGVWVCLAGDVSGEHLVVAVIDLLFRCAM